MLDGDVLVLEIAHLALGGAQRREQVGRGRRLGLAGERRHLAQRGVDVGAQRVGGHADLAEDGHDDAALLVEEGGEQVA